MAYSDLLPETIFFSISHRYHSFLGAHAVNAFSKFRQTSLKDLGGEYRLSVRMRIQFGQG